MEAAGSSKIVVNMLSLTCDAVTKALPNLCEPLPAARVSIPLPSPEEKALLAKFHDVKAYRDRVWGPALWTALEAMVLSLPNSLDEQEFCSFKLYLALSARYMPCENCGRHFTQHLAAMPNTLTIRTRAGVLKWLTDVKNDVNRRNSKPILGPDEIVTVLTEKGKGESGSEKKTHMGTNTTTATKKKINPTIKSSDTYSTNSSDGPSLASIILLAVAVALLSAVLWYTVVRKAKSRKAKSTQGRRPG